MNWTVLSRAASLAAIVCAASCSSSTTTPDSARGDSMPPDSGTPETAPSSETSAPTTTMSLKLSVPADFKGEATRLIVAAFSKLPVAGPPDGGILYQDNAPKITPGGTLVIAGDATGITGAYYVLAVLYVKGGGSFAPKDGVDYDAATSAPIAFDGKPVDAGSLSLAVHRAGDGH